MMLTHDFSGFKEASVCAMLAGSIQTSFVKFNTFKAVQTVLIEVRLHL